MSHNESLSLEMLRDGTGAAVRDNRGWPLPRRDAHFALETCVLPSRTTVGTARSSAKCTSRRGGRGEGPVEAEKGGSRVLFSPHRDAAHGRPRQVIHRMCSFRRFRVFFPPVSVKGGAVERAPQPSTVLTRLARSATSGTGLRLRARRRSRQARGQPAASPPSRVKTRARTPAAGRGFDRRASTAPGAGPRFARSPGRRRDRHLTREHVT